MKWDQKRVDAILAQSDEELLPKARAVMEALGLPEAMQAEVLSDLPALREKAQEIGEADFARARLLLGSQQLESLVQILEQNHG